MLENKHIEIICNALGISKENIVKIKENLGGLSNYTYVVTLDDGRKYLYRIPGKRTEVFTNRRSEYETYRLIKPYNIAHEVVYFDADSGLKMTVYYTDVREAEVNSDSDCIESMNMLKRFQSLPIKLTETLTVFDRISKNIKFYGELGGKFSDDFNLWMNTKFVELKKAYEEYKVDLLPCAGDYTLGNVLIKEDGTSILIDLEYAANGDPYMDIATFAHDKDMSAERTKWLLDVYLGRKATEKELRRLFIQCALTGIRWYTWSECKIKINGVNQEYTDFSARSIKYADKFYELVTK